MAESLPLESLWWKIALRGAVVFLEIVTSWATAGNSAIVEISLSKGCYVTEWCMM